MNRRQFLQVSLAAGVVAAMPITLKKALADPRPTIWADGIHDDTAGLQAAIDGQPFYAVHDVVNVTDGKLTIHDGRFRTSACLNFRNHKGLRFERNHVISSSPDYIIDLGNSEDGMIAYNYFEGTIPKGLLA